MPRTRHSQLLPFHHHTTGYSPSALSKERQQLGQILSVKESTPTTALLKLSQESSWDGASLQLKFNFTELTCSLRQSRAASTSALWAQAYPSVLSSYSSYREGGWVGWGCPDPLTLVTEMKQQWLQLSYSDCCWQSEIVKSTALTTILLLRMGGWEEV